ncbi:alpha/beta-hydrolase [Xylariaceae sp. FL0255]|nr:alpha/beta-hydrolase [Xylariaceae sp. FL0255]
MATELATLRLASSRSLSYAFTTPPSGSSSPVVLLSNSLCAPFTCWDPVVPKLASLGFSVLRYDQPGHGDSGVPEVLSSTTFESMVDDAHEMLSQLGIKKVHAWIGVSMGAATGIVFAAKYPGLVERLVPCDTISCSPANAGSADVFGPRVTATREAGNVDALVEGTMERWFGSAWMEANAAETERMRKEMRRTTVEGFETCCTALRSTTFDLRPLAAKAGAGVDSAMLLVGSKDANLPETMQGLREGVEKGLNEKSGNAKYVELKVIKDAGHVCFIDGFDSFVSHVSKFLTA